mgnify:CR=1 FL=1
MDLKKLTDQVTAISVDVAAFIRSEAGRLTEARVSTKSVNNLVTVSYTHLTLPTSDLV